MTLDPKDYIAIAAFSLSVISLAKSFLEGRRSKQIAFEQRRQELLLVRFQTQQLRERSIRMLTELKRELLMAGKEPLALNVEIYKGKLEVGSIFSGALSIAFEAFPHEFATHEKLVELEGNLGKAKRELEDEKAKSQTAIEFASDVRKRAES